MIHRCARVVARRMPGDGERNARILVPGEVDLIGFPRFGALQRTNDEEPHALKGPVAPPIVLAQEGPNRPQTFKWTGLDSSDRRPEYQHELVQAVLY